MAFHIVPIESLADVWPEVCPWIEDAIQHGQGDQNALDVFICLARGIYSLWHEPGKFAMVVHIMPQPRQKVATVIYCGGSDLRAIAEAFEFGKKWGRENGINVIRVWGRPGWERVLGLKRIGVISQVKL